MSSTFKHPYEDCVVGNKSTLYTPNDKFDTACLYAVPFAAADAEKNAKQRDDLQTEMERYVAKLRSRRARRRQGMAFYASLLRGVPIHWRDYYDRWLRFFQSEIGMFKWRDDVELRRYQRARKYCAIVECNGTWLYGVYASRRELEQDVGPLKNI